MTLSPDQLARLRAKYAAQTAADRPAPKRAAKRPSGKLAAELLAAGWTRSEHALDECGAETEVSICHHPAHWERHAPYRGPLCAQHALQAQRDL